MIQPMALCKLWPLGTRGGEGFLRRTLCFVIWSAIVNKKIVGRFANDEDDDDNAFRHIKSNSAAWGALQS